MKIAIQGHATRGKEVIQLLESLGGKKRDDLTGRMFSQYYFINCYGDIDLNLKINLLDHKFYTIEEFPFKIGDKVKDCSDDEIGTILGFIDIDGELMYVVNFEKSGHANMPAEELKPYKEMERNIKIGLKKAKEWYSKGGELKEIALQAFTEKELNPLPRSWEEFVESTKFTFNCSLEYINGIGHWSNGCLPNKSIGESSEIWNKHVALFQLEQLRNFWIQNRTYKWDDHSFKYQIKFMYNHYEILALKCVRNFLTFPTKEMAEEFLECFRDLIEKAGDLI